MKKQLRALLAKNKLPELIRQLSTLAAQIGDKDLEDEVVLQAALLEQYFKENRQQRIANRENQPTLARINKALLELIDRLPDEEEKRLIGKIQQAKWWQWVVALGILLAIPAAIAEFTGYSIRDFLGFTTKDSFTLTVLVHGKAGTDDRILQNQGKVVLDFGNTREEEMINGEGEATFKELPSYIADKEVRISIAHAQPYFPTNRDSIYLLKKGQSIYLEVELTGLERIKGFVYDFETEQPLDSVRVSIEDTATYSKKNGYFSLNIPPELRAKFLQVTFSKDNYKQIHLDSIAPHTKQSIQISLNKYPK